jgi:hypothetical protein
MLTIAEIEGSRDLNRRDRWCALESWWKKGKYISKGKVDVSSTAQREVRK